MEISTITKNKNNGNIKNQLLRTNQIGAAIRKIILFLSPPTITAKQRKLKEIMQNASKVYKTLMRGTFKKRAAQSEHLGGLYGNGFGKGEDNIDPLEESTYMSSGTILSFCTPAHTPKTN